MAAAPQFLSTKTTSTLYNEKDNTTVFDKTSNLSFSSEAHIYTILRPIGEGSFAKVYQGIDETGAAVAIKVNKLSRDCFAVLTEEQKFNHDLVKSRAHPLDLIERHRILPLLDSAESDSTSLALVFPYCEHKTLSIITKINLKNDPANILENAKDSTFQILTSLFLLHNQGFIHADLKPSNILMHNPQLALLADFGAAHKVSDRTYGEHPELFAPVYRAPEIFNKSGYDTSADMWAVGCTVYYMLTGEHLFFAEDEASVCALVNNQEFKNAKLEILKEKYGNEAFDFVRRALRIDPSKRMTVKKAITDPFLQIPCSTVSHPKLTFSSGPVKEKDNKIQATTLGGKPVVLKRYKNLKCFLNELEMLQYLTDEASNSNLLQTAHHILQFLEFSRSALIFPRYESSASAFIQKSFVQGKHQKTEVIEQARRLLDDLLHGVSFIHSRNIVHGNIQPAHMAIDRPNKLFLQDFRTSFVKNAPEDFQSTETKNPYSANEDKLDLSADMFAVGSTLYFFLTGDHLFEGYSGRDHRYINRKFDGLRAKFRETHNQANIEQAISFLERTLGIEPNARMTAGQALKHPFLNPSFTPSRVKK
ncbi:MAG: protein kinase [Simkaniaceae bacterium]|nr:protein kinase [Simkaniaceae bacterium]